MPFPQKYAKIIPLMKIKVAASILSCDFGRLEEEIKKSAKAGIDLFHLDIMDGHFVPNISFGQPIVKTVRSITSLPLNAHLMIDNPELYIEDFAKNCDMVTLHIESYEFVKPPVKEIKASPRVGKEIDFTKLKMDLRFIKSLDKKAGIAINPPTPIELLFEVLEDVDLVLIMGVNPGFSGQKFTPKVLEKINKLRKEFEGDISVDGGVNEITSREIIKAGANILVTASYLYSSRNYKKIVETLKKTK